MFRAQKVRRRRQRAWLTLAGVVMAMSLFVAFRVQKKSSSPGYSSVSHPVQSPTPTPDLTTPGKIIGLKHLATVSQDTLDSQSRQLFAPTTFSAAKVGVEEYQFSYTSKDPRSERLILLTGRAYIPHAAHSAPGFIFGPGTTGPGAICAPSLEQSRHKNWGQYDSHLAYYAGQGYAVATTDYDNRDTPGGLSHYFVGEVEARAMLDLARAMLSFSDKPRFEGQVVANSFFMAGFSQGGHAALWADQLNTEYAPDISIKGVVGFAPATDLQRTFLDTVNGTATIWLPPYLLAAYNDYYQVDIKPESMLLEPFSTSLAHDVSTNCIDQLEVHSGHYGPSTNTAKVYSAAFIDSLRLGQFAQNFPVLANLLSKNLAGAQAAHVPVLTLAGEKDYVILAGAQVDLTKRLCQGAIQPVGLSIYPGATHYNIMSVAASQSLSWMEQVLSHQPVASDCPRYSL